MNPASNVVEFIPPKKPRIKLADPLPSARSYAVLPIRAVMDKQLTHGMLKVLMLLCSYVNRAGITWVSQDRLGKDMNVSQQAISKQLVKLQKLGYIQIARYAKRGERHTTWRVVYDASITAEDAIAITSAIEDTRSPGMKRHQQLEADRDGQQRIASIIAKAIKPMPTERTPMARSKKTVQPLAVVQPQPVDNSGILQPPGGCLEDEKNTSYKKVLEVLNNQQVSALLEFGLKRAEIAAHLELLLEAYQAEGIRPRSEQLVADVLQLSRDAKRA